MMTDIDAFHESDCLERTKRRNLGENLMFDEASHSRKYDARCLNCIEIQNRTTKRIYRLNSLKRIWLLVAISILIQSHTSFVDCAGTSDLLGIDINDARKSSDEDSITNGVGAGNTGANAGLYFDKIGGSLEMSIAAVFNKVAYGTTTKRSLPDNVFVPTMPTPQLTTYRWVQ